MSTLRTIWSKLRSLGQQRAVKHEIDEELRFHIEQRTAENIAAGMSPEEAAREARRRFGNVQSVREECRDARGASFGETTLRDLRVGFRVLAKSPGFTLVAVLMLGLGIGSATGMFGVMRAVIFKPYSSPNGDRLVYVWSDSGGAISTPEYFAIAEQATSFAAFGRCVPGRMNVGGDHPRSVRGVSCTPGVLRAFGVAPVLGRRLELSDEHKGAPRVVVISYRLWQQLYNGDSGVIGRTLRLDDNETMVVGVMPAGFEFYSPWLNDDACEIWQPLQLQSDQASGWNWSAVGCLKKGVTITAAEAEINAIGKLRKDARSDIHSKNPFVVRSLRAEIARYVSSYAWMIFGATLLVLLVSCANVASMLLARGMRRQGEFGVRIAMGASRSQIFRLVFSESVLLSAGGIVAGAGVAVIALSYFRSLEGLTEARRAAMVLDGHVFAFAVGLALLAGLFAGFPPALAALRISVNDLLRTDNRGAAGSSTRHRLLRGLIVMQIAVAFILANLAILFSASYAKMVAANTRLATDYVLSAELDLHGARYAANGALARFCDQLAERAAAIPDIAAVGMTTDLPLEWGPCSDLLANDEVFDPAIKRPTVVFSAVTPGYFSAADIPLLKGRTLHSGDAGWGDIGVVVNRAFAEKYWPGQDPLGKIVRANAPKPWFYGHVAGVVDNVRQLGVRSEPQPHLYWTIDHAWGTTVFLVARSERAGTLLAPELRRAVAEMDPDLPLFRIRTFKTIVREATQSDRVIAGLTKYCMIMAIGLVAVGLYGTLSYHVLQRTREIGVRMALGADRHDVVRLVFRQGFSWVLIGTIIGIGGALASATALRAMVYDINTLNPLALVSAATAVFVAATLACWLPARRASKVHPMEALRCE